MLSHHSKCSIKGHSFCVYLNRVWDAFFKRTYSKLLHVCFLNYYKSLLTVAVTPRVFAEVDIFVWVMQFRRSFVLQNLRLFCIMSAPIVITIVVKWLSAVYDYALHTSRFVYRVRVLDRVCKLWAQAPQFSIVTVSFVRLIYLFFGAASSSIWGFVDKSYCA